MRQQQAGCHQAAAAPAAMKAAENGPAASQAAADKEARRQRRLAKLQAQQDLEDARAEAAEPGLFRDVGAQRWASPEAEAAPGWRRRWELHALSALGAAAPARAPASPPRAVLPRCARARALPPRRMAAAAGPARARCPLISVHPTRARSTREDKARTDVKRGRFSAGEKQKIEEVGRARVCAA